MWHPLPPTFGVSSELATTLLSNNKHLTSSPRLRSSLHLPLTPLSTASLPPTCPLHSSCILSTVPARLSHLESGPCTAAPYPGPVPQHRSCLHLALSSHQCDGSWGSPSHPELSQVSPPALVSPSISPTQPEAPGGQLLVPRTQEAPNSTC